MLHFYKMDNGTYQIFEDDRYIYNYEKVLSEIDEMKRNLSELRDMDERIAYFKSITW